MLPGRPQRPSTSGASGVAPPRVLFARALRTISQKNANFRPYDVRTKREPHSERIYLRATPPEIAALDHLVAEWNASRSQIIRSMIVGAALAQLDRLDEALVAIEPSFDALVDLPSIDDALAGL
jgi:hypothetical protein